MQDQRTDRRCAPAMRRSVHDKRLTALRSTRMMAQCRPPAPARRFTKDASAPTWEIIENKQISKRVNTIL